MKFLIVLLIVLTPFILFGQEYYEYTAKHLFDNSSATLNGTAGSVDDQVAFNTTLGYYEITSTAAADTLISDKITLVRAGNDITVYCGIDSVSGTTSALVQFGYYRGIELGWSWNTITTFTADGASTTYKIPAQTFADEVLHQFGIKITETGVQVNDFWFRIKTFRWR